MAKPFLKWAGGKGKIADQILAGAPDAFERYIEPFVGGGAVFFALRANRPATNVVLGDSNAELIESYTVVRDNVEGLAKELERHSRAYLGRKVAEARAEYFYEQRAMKPRSAVRRAARLIFLNKTCYNGLYRVNRSGQFNTPHGRYGRPTILDKKSILGASSALQGAVLTCGTFEQTCASAGEGDFVYLDPPYQPLSRTANFTAYTAEDFDIKQQRALKDSFDALTQRGAKALLSNSEHPVIRELYAGYHFETVAMSRAINSNARARRAIDDLLIRNF